MPIRCLNRRESLPDRVQGQAIMNVGVCDDIIPIVQDHERMPKYPAVKRERRHRQQDAKTSLNQFSETRFDHGCVAKRGRESSILLDLTG